MVFCLKKSLVISIDIIKKLGRSRATITRQIQKLKEMLLVKRIGSDKSGHWKVI
ncbi:MAG: HTH domain-containing protein [Spirochaetes bacterium]|nr:HTH domain-containing protein [Spirochaetota bacterium]